MTICPPCSTTESLRQPSSFKGFVVEASDTRCRTDLRAMLPCVSRKDTVLDMHDHMNFVVKHLDSLEPLFSSLLGVLRDETNWHIDAKAQPCGCWSESRAYIGERRMELIHWMPRPQSFCSCCVVVTSGWLVKLIATCSNVSGASLL